MADSQLKSSTERDTQISESALAKANEASVLAAKVLDQQLSMVPVKCHSVLGDIYLEKKEIDAAERNYTAAY